MINELRYCPTISANVYLDNNEQASRAVLTAMVSLHIRNIILLNLNYMIIDHR